MTQAWPMGDRPDTGAVARRRRHARSSTRRSTRRSADPAALTAAFLVVYKGRIIAERYAPGITKDTQLESWSMGKSIASTLFSLLVKDGTYTLEQPAPVPLWQRPGDPRAAIRNIDLLRMSAGLKFVGNQEGIAADTCSITTTSTRAASTPSSTRSRGRRSSRRTRAASTATAIR